MLISGEFSSELMNATAQFVEEVDDPKAALLVVDIFTGNEVRTNQFSLLHSVSFTEFLRQLMFWAVMFYNAPEPPSGVFDEFTAIPSISVDVSTRSYISLLDSIPSAVPASRCVYMLTKNTPHN